MLKILIVDDEPALAVLFHHLLERYGFQVESYDSGPAAIRRAGEFRPDVLLCDLHMPLNGIEVARQVKSIVPHCRLLLISGADPVGIDCKELPLQIMQKPISVEELLRELGIDMGRMEPRTGTDC